MNHERPAEPLKSEDIQRQIQALSSRDLQLWSIGLMMILVLSAGFLALIFPNLAWRTQVNVDTRMLPQFFFGLVTLILLFNVYVISQKKSMNATRRELIRELVFSERMESLSMLDPATQLLNRRAVDEMLPQEVARANRMGTNLSVLITRVDSLPVVKARYGFEAANKFVLEVAKVIKATFRGSDIVARYNDSEFLVMLPGTSEQQAECAIRRLQEAADHWNVTTKTGWEISLVHGLAAHASGSEAVDLLRTAERKLSPHREKLTPIFLPVASTADGPSHLVL